MKKLLAYSFVAIGLLLLAYPGASQWYNDRQQQKLLEAWEASAMQEEASQEARQQYDGLTNLFAEVDGDNGLPEATSFETQPAASQQPEPTKQPAALNAIASIKIPSIKLNLPVLEGATQKNMKYAAAHLKETSPLGAVGNAAIAAHRMKARGSLFNRLDEVKVGDKIIVETKNETFTYTVYNVSIVEPTDVSVLNYNQTDKRLTLITCDPIVNPTHRLIVHAEMS
ncbi:class D sortase [Paenibacillus sp. CAU 1782]